MNKTKTTTDIFVADLLNLLQAAYGIASVVSDGLKHGNLEPWAYAEVAGILAENIDNIAIMVAGEFEDEQEQGA